MPQDNNQSHIKEWKRSTQAVIEETRGPVYRWFQQKCDWFINKMTQF
jgi:hypothetical protein